jgi:hypothetical protein
MKKIRNLKKTFSKSQQKQNSINANTQISWKAEVSLFFVYSLFFQKKENT